MNSIKQNLRALTRGKHWLANPNNLKNSCWELRKAARGKDKIPEANIEQPRVVTEERMDRIFYKPTDPKERLYRRTWADFGDEIIEEPEIPQPPRAELHPPVRKRPRRQSNKTEDADSSREMQDYSGSNNSDILTFPR